MFGYGMGGGVVETVMSPILLSAAGRDQLGRVLSLFSSALRLASIVSLGVVGWLAGLLPPGGGRVDLVLAGAGLMFLPACAYAALSLRPERSGREDRAAAGR